MSLSVVLENVNKIFPITRSATDNLIDAISAVEHNKLSEDYKIAVQSVNLSITEGERLGIVGRNGAGKSTLLHMIAGTADPTEGRIIINGKVSSILTLGVGIRDDLSGRENIYVDGEIQGKSRNEIDKVIEDIIDFSELGKFIDYPVRTYSTGMKARLAFAMVTHVEPEILIIDEALSVGDAAFANKAKDKIIEICSKGKIVILVSHSMASICEICNRCIYLKDGHIIMDGTPNDVTKAYIEEVKYEDDAALIKKFSMHVGNHSFEEGYLIRNVKLAAGDYNNHALRFEIGQRFRACVYVDFPFGDISGFCRIKIVRLDELILFMDDFLAEDYFSENQYSYLEFEFSNLQLGPGIYKFEVEIRKNKSVNSFVQSKSSSIFEVYTETVPTGGKPMIYHTISMQAEYQKD